MSYPFTDYELFDKNEYLTTYAYTIMKVLNG